MCVTTPAITHVQKASTTPENGHIALLESLAESCDTLGGVGAVKSAPSMIPNEATKCIVVQAAKHRTHE